MSVPLKKTTKHYHSPLLKVTYFHLSQQAELLCSTWRTPKSGNPFLASPKTLPIRPRLFHHFMLSCPCHLCPGIGPLLEPPQPPHPQIPPNFPIPSTLPHPPCVGSPPSFHLIPCVPPISKVFSKVASPASPDFSHFSRGPEGIKFNPLGCAFANREYRGSKAAALGTGKEPRPCVLAPSSMSLPLHTRLCFHNTLHGEAVTYLRVVSVP